MIWMSKSSPLYHAREHLRYPFTLPPAACTLSLIEESARSPLYVQAKLFGHLNRFFASLLDGAVRVIRLFICLLSNRTSILVALGTTSLIKSSIDISATVPNFLGLTGISSAKSWNTLFPSIDFLAFLSAKITSLTVMSVISACRLGSASISPSSITLASAA